ncbi:hypothetical protein OG689_10470 [Kitasatospora sp. NBC_00240]|uniref:hypothetical protein n=1 Tax=Kitasatospora sp. NBC_00240 TaxID=2903567 RepID=UPI002252DD30|nr:hypothetical protein [Kitasatospora sp. NBC_00240]MCX5209706.1 hypothetical protein [Kitasatospora sp. NBC_00240]
MNANSTPTPQHSPALALVQLTGECNAPAMNWSISTTSAGLHGSLAAHDARPMVRLYVDLLDATPLTPLLYVDGEGHRRVTELLSTTWRDVPITLSFSSDLSAYPELVEAEERALLCRFLCEHDDPFQWCPETWLQYRAELDALRLEVAA